MSDPTAAVRARTYERDGHRCISCGSSGPLQYQHRAAVGMGGSDVRPQFVDGLTSCSQCNEGYESHLQSMALRFGWKVRRWVHEQGKTGEVPVFCWPERTWYALTVEGRRVRVSTVVAIRMMKAVYGPSYVEGVGPIR